jgi:hypothetical protein
MSYDSKSELVQGRKLKVQRLVIPFSIVGSATSTAVVARSDEPGLMFFNTEGVTGISTASGALNSGDTATFTVSPNDTNCTFNVLIKVDEPVAKVCMARCMRRSATLSEADDAMITALGNSTGVVVNSTSAQKIMLTIDGELALNAANTLNACLEVAYVVAE